MRIIKFDFRPRIVVIAVLGLFLSGCTGMLTFSPEQAVVQELMSDRYMGQTIPESIQIMQKLEVGNRILILTTFQSAQENGEVMDCTFVIEPQKRFGNWMSMGGGGGCGSGPDPKQPVDVGGGIRSGSDHAYSYVYGKVNNPEVTTIAVIWDNGETQNEPVINGSYLIYRTGGHEMQGLKAYDSENNMIYDHESSIAPGKK